MGLTLNFQEEKSGYNKAQVDAYLEKVQREYDRVQQKCRALEEKCLEQEKKCLEQEQDMTRLTHEKKAASGLAAHFRVKLSQLERENARLNARPPERVSEHADEVARVLRDAEVLAGQIIERAREEAVRLTQEAQAENDRITASREPLLSEIRNHWEALRVSTP